MMRFLFVFLFLAVSGFGQTVEKRAGETATLTVCGAEGDKVNFYRKTSPVATPWLIGTKTRTAGLMHCIELRYLMPTGTTPEYRFFATPVKGVEALEDTNGVRVKRKP